MDHLCDLLESFWETALRFGDYESRADQREYVTYVVGETVVVFFLMAFTFMLTFIYSLNPESLWLWMPWRVVGLVLLVPMLAVSVRRLHDFGRSGWWAILLVVPATSLFFTIALMLIPGTEGENQYG